MLPIETVLAEIRLDLNIHSDKYSTNLKMWIYDALCMVASHKNVLKEKVFPIVGNSFPVPKGYHSIEDMVLCGDKKRERPIIANVDMRLCHECNNDYRVEKQGNYFVMSSNVAQHFDKAILYFYANPMDDNGNPIVDERYMLMLKAYCRYKMDLMDRRKHRDSNASRNNPVNLGELDRSLRDFNIQLELARSYHSGKIDLNQIGQTLTYGRPIPFL